LYRVTDEQFRTYEIRAQQLRLALNYPVTGAAGINPNPSPVWSDDLEIQVNVTDVRIDGRGDGHGVGLCQWCSKGMAERGVSWRDMITTFYPGAQISRAY
jgi:SpoIID/LytB domain protein